LKGLLLAKNNFLRIFGDIEDFFKEWQDQDHRDYLNILEDLLVNGKATEVIGNIL
jgi:hypothetical protein